MKSLLASDITGIIIQIIGAVISGLISNWLTNRREKSKTSSANNEKDKIKLKQALITGSVAAITFIFIGLIYNFFQPIPSVTIKSPRMNENISVQLRNEGGAFFQISGVSERVVRNERLGVMVLIHPVDPFAEGWWVQSPVSMQPDGTWKGQAQIGDLDHPPKEGDLLEIVAVVADRSLKQSGEHIVDPKELNIESQSSIIRVQIGGLK